MPYLYGDAFQKSQVLAGVVLIKKEEVELIGLPRAMIPSLGREYVGIWLLKKGQRRGSLAGKGSSPFCTKLIGAI